SLHDALPIWFMSYAGVRIPAPADPKQALLISRLRLSSYAGGDPIRLRVCFRACRVARGFVLDTEFLHLVEQRLVVDLQQGGGLLPIPTRRMQGRQNRVR